jgi:hypothetical protein
MCAVQHCAAQYVDSKVFVPSLMEDGRWKMEEPFCISLYSVGRPSSVFTVLYCTALYIIRPDLEEDGQLEKIQLLQGASIGQDSLRIAKGVSYSQARKPRRNESAKNE